MSSEVFIDNNGSYDRDHRRSRDEVLPDYKFHELLNADLQDISIDQALESDSLEENLRDDRLYFVNKNYYHTSQNVDSEIASNINAGPNNEGIAGDLDVGYIEVPSSKLVKIELKSPGRIPPLEVRKESERTYDPISHGRKQNRYLARLLENIERKEDVFIPYSSRVESWQDATDRGIDDITRIPPYSTIGDFVASEEAREAAQESFEVNLLNEALFNGNMFVESQNILEEMD